MQKRQLALVVTAAALGAGGISWAATGASTQSVITACANADKVLSLSTGGSCPAGNTLVRWNEQGPPGPAGATRPPPVLAFGQSQYVNGFSIKAEIDQPGQYWIDGSADLSLKPVPAHNHHHSFAAYCRLYTGPVNGSATMRAQWRLVFIRHSASYVPASVSGPVDADTVSNVSQSDVPLEVYLSCHGGPDAHWTHPAITIEATTSTVFHQHVGPALPKRRVIGPGPLKKL